jgi:hypothetical protein
MNIDLFNLLETKRKHVRKYNNKIPPKEIIEKALWKAWKTSPSKNNAMPYQALIWGPNKQEYKDAIHSLVVKKHKDVEDKAVKDGLATTTQNTELGVKENPYYYHIKNNPYLITVHSRVSTPNKYYKKQIEKGHFYNQGSKDHIEKIIDSVAVEVGIFISTLAAYLLEEGLDITYNSCFKRNVKEWHKVGLNMVEFRPIIFLSCGYGEKYKRDDLKNPEIVKLYGEHLKDIVSWDVKPEMKDIIKWM